MNEDSMYHLPKIRPLSKISYVYYYMQLCWTRNTSTMKTGMEPTNKGRSHIWCYCIYRYNKRSLQNHYSYGTRITTVRDHKPEAGYEANVEDCMTHVHGSDTENRSSFFLTYGWQWCEQQACPALLLIFRWRHCIGQGHGDHEPGSYTSSW